MAGWLTAWLAGCIVTGARPQMSPVIYASVTVRQYDPDPS